MQKSSSSRGDLITWYLARLRNNARQSSLERKLTPLTLVQTDRNLIQEIVASSHVGHEQKSAGVLKTLRLQNQGIRVSQNILLLLTGLGAIVLLALVLF